jgi:hypothetical protein
LLPDITKKSGLIKIKKEKPVISLESEKSKFDLVLKGYTHSDYGIEPDAWESDQITVKIWIRHEERKHEFIIDSILYPELQGLREFMESMLLPERPAEDIFYFFAARLSFQYKKLSSGKINLSIIIHHKYLPDDWPYVDGKVLGMKMTYILSDEDVKTLLEQMDLSMLERIEI